MRTLAAALTLILIAAGCRSGSGSPPAVSGPRLTVTVYAAASLSGALAAARTAYAAVAPNVTLTISTDSSATLRTQIEQGAPADLFLSADTTNAVRLATDGFADGSPVPFAGNELTIIVPSTNAALIRSPVDLARPGLKIIAAGDAVPITTYAAKVVSRLAHLPGYPAGFAAAYAANIVSREDNVEAVVAKIELGEGDAALVYVTDAAASTRVGTIAIPAAANVPATYDGVVVRTSPNRAAATAFLVWLSGSSGQAILARFGFTPPAP